MSTLYKKTTIFQKTFHIVALTAIGLLLHACRSTTQYDYSIVSIRGERVEMNSLYDTPENTAMAKLVDKYKKQLDFEMNQVIGTSSQLMKKGQPESLLTNFSADVMRNYLYTFARIPSDIALINVQAHRGDIPQGDITTRSIYEVYPFDNQLIKKTITGKQLMKVLRACVTKGGLGISSNVKVVAVSGNIKTATIDGQPIDPKKIYTLITVDYLADGNSGMSVLRKTKTTESLNIYLRDIIIEYIKHRTKQGQAISSSIDGRFIISK